MKSAMAPMPHARRAFGDIPEYLLIAERFRALPLLSSRAVRGSPDVERAGPAIEGRTS